MLSFFRNKNNCLDITAKLLTLLNVPVTFSTVENDLYNHPDYPSLLSVSDVLLKYGVNNLSLKIPPNQLTEIPLPCIAPVKDKDKIDYFTILKAVGPTEIEYCDPRTYAWKKISVGDFQEMWPSGIVFLLEAEHAQGEKEYKKRLRDQQRAQLLDNFLWLSMPALALVSIVLICLTPERSTWSEMIFEVVTFIGCVIGGLLLWYELDEYNPLLRQMCSIGQKTNCSAILNSKASKILGVSWSTIGFSYFTSQFFIMLILGSANMIALSIIAWLNLVAVPYVVFSIYYQWKVARQWCVLCLGIQSLLLLQFVTASLAGWRSVEALQAALTPQTILPVILTLILPFVVVNLLVPAYKGAKEGKRLKADLLRLKHDPLVFNALLAKEKVIQDSTTGLGITLGNPNAKHTLIKVCGPFCTPCADAHPLIEQLIETNPDIKLQIIFNAYDHGYDKSAYPAKHLLAIQESSNESVLKEALNDWYVNIDREYEVFAKKYPMGEELERQLPKITSMRNWCDKTDITFTPTFFLNGQQLPEIYSVADLNYFLSV